MLLSELPAYLETELSYPVELETVIEQAGTVEIEAPDAGDSETIASVLEPLASSSFESPADLYLTIYGSVGDDYIGRKFYDDRGSNPMEARRGPVDDRNVSF